MREDFLEMVVHPSLGPPIDDTQIGAVAANRAVVFLGCNHLQDNIDRACSTSCPLLPVMERWAGFLGHIFLVD